MNRFRAALIALVALTAITGGLIASSDDSPSALAFADSEQVTTSLQPTTPPTEGPTSTALRATLPPATPPTRPVPTWSTTADTSAFGDRSTTSTTTAPATTTTTPTTTTTTAAPSTTTKTATTAATTNPPTTNPPPTTSPPTTSPPTTTTAATGDHLTQADAHSFALLNQLRANVGVGSVAVDAQMSAFATDWSQEMSATGFRHSSGPYAENIVWYSNESLSPQQAAASFHDSWVNSPGHYANMTNSRWTHVGIGLYRDAGGWWGTHVFS